MKNFEELDYYEILNIPVDASPFEISRAYKNALEVYGESSLLTYSLFSEVYLWPTTLFVGNQLLFYHMPQYLNATKLHSVTL